MVKTISPISRRQAFTWALATCAGSPSLFGSGAAAATPMAEPLVLPATPSEMLRASAAVWAPFLSRLEGDVANQLQQPDGRTPAQQSELYIHQVLLAQAQGHWYRVSALTDRARRLQETPAGRLVAGVLNELLAKAQLERLTAKGLSDITRDRFAAMPWSVVGPDLRTMHQQLRNMKAEHVENMVALRLDPSASIAKGNVSLGFAMQLVGLRLQLTQVLPNRDALVLGLGAVLSIHALEEARGSESNGSGPLTAASDALE